MPYVATINVPGYLQMDDDPPVFETAQEAWQYLADERALDEGADADEDFVSETLEQLYYLGTSIGSGEGTVYGDTPGYEGSHDLGLAYCVTFVPDEDVTE